MSLLREDVVRGANPREAFRHIVAVLILEQDRHRRGRGGVVGLEGATMGIAHVISQDLPIRLDHPDVGRIATEEVVRARRVSPEQAGANAELDEAILRRSEMETFLRQDMHVGVEIGATVDFLKTFAVAGGS